MRGLGKTVLGISAAAFFLVLYVHGHVSLFRISYDLQSRNITLTKMSEEYRRLRFEVDQLKAPRLLEMKMKELSLDLTLPQEIRVVKTPLPAAEARLHEIPMPLTGRLADFFGRFVEIAQAKTDN